MEKIFQMLGRYMPLNQELRDDLAANLYVRKEEKGTILISEDRVCDQLFFIRKGFLRGFHYHNGRK